MTCSNIRNISTFEWTRFCFYSKNTELNRGAGDERALRVSSLSRTLKIFLKKQRSLFGHGFGFGFGFTIVATLTLHCAPQSVYRQFRFLLAYNYSLQPARSLQAIPEWRMAGKTKPWVAFGGTDASWVYTYTIPESESAEPRVPTIELPKAGDYYLHTSACYRTQTRKSMRAPWVSP